MTENIQNGFTTEIASIGSSVDNASSFSCLIPSKCDTELVNKVVNRIKAIDILLNEKKCYMKGNQLFSDQQTIKNREKIAINVKETIIGSEKIWIWVAVDLMDEMVIAVNVSYVKNRATMYRFLQKVANLCKGALPIILINSESWKNQWPFQRIGFRYIPVDFGAGSVAEKFLLKINCRMSRFIEKLPGNITADQMLWWVEGAAGFTNYWTAKNRVCL